MADEMTLQQIAERLDVIQGDIRTIKKDVGTLKTDLSSLRDEMKIQFEETHRLIRFGFEAREGLRETMASSFKKPTANTTSRSCC